MKQSAGFLAKEGPLFGLFAKTRDPAFIEIMGMAGMDFVILDLEHGPSSPESVYPLILAAEANGMAPVVRVGELSAIRIQRVMDLAPAGVQIPQIQDRIDAERVRQFAKFHPEGARGVCRYVRAADFSLKDKSVYFREQNRVPVIIHIEGKRGAENIDEIIEVAGIDVVFIGPYDLSQSLGVPGRIEHPRLLTEIEKLVAKCRARQKHVGIFTESLEAAERYCGMGVKYISYSVDVGVFASAVRALAEAFAGLKRT